MGGTGLALSLWGRDESPWLATAQVGLVGVLTIRFHVPMAAAILDYRAPEAVPVIHSPPVLLSRLRSRRTDDGDFDNNRLVRHGCVRMSPFVMLRNRHVVLSMFTTQLHCRNRDAVHITPYLGITVYIYEKAPQARSCMEPKSTRIDPTVLFVQ